MDIFKLSLPELEELKGDLDQRIREVRRREKMSKQYTKEQIIAMFDSFGYVVPKGTKIWKISDLEHGGAFGMEVGSYTHSCHIDTTYVKVLLVVDGEFHGVKDYGEMWLVDPIVV